MAHKTLIGGTAYDVIGGKTLVGGAAYDITGGKTLVGGTAYDILFGDIPISEWPADVNTGLEFVSANSFSISVSSPQWDGTLEYTNGKEWKIWDGSEIPAGWTKGGHRIYIRGTGNREISGGISGTWTLSGTNIQCNGNIENLLDYTTVQTGAHPTMSSYCYCNMFQNCTSLTIAPSLPATSMQTQCYNSMFYGCTNLTTAPSLPATSLQFQCYSFMFYGCTSLTTAPSLPATSLAENCYLGMFQNCTSLTIAPSLPATSLTERCYEEMFYGCTSLTTVPSLHATSLEFQCYKSMFRDCEKIKLSATATGEYNKAYRIPSSGTGETASNALTMMFENTGGTFKGTPTINTTYYLNASNAIV